MILEASLCIVRRFLLKKFQISFKLSETEGTIFLFVSEGSESNNLEMTAGNVSVKHF